ncbi:unknown [Sinorhizobium phage PBC5]|nr:unknown [Sinorhizobium phage PBC5]
MLRRYPRRAGLHIDVDCLDVRRLHVTKSCDVAPEIGVRFGGAFGLGELLLDVAGQVVVGRFVVSGRRLVEQRTELLDDRVRRFAVERRHGVEVHAAEVVQDGGECIFRARRAGRAAVGLLRALGEDGGLLGTGGLYLLAGALRHGGADTLVVVLLQRADLRPSRIITEEPLVGVRIDRAMLFREAVIERVEASSQVLDLLIRGLLVDLGTAELGEGVADAHHAGNAVLRRVIRERHSLRYGLAEMVGHADMHCAVGRCEHCADLHVLDILGEGDSFCHRLRPGLDHDIFRQGPDGLGEQCRKIVTAAGDQRRIIGAVHRPIGAEVTEHHVGLVDEVLVERDSLAILALPLADLRP